MPPTALLSGSSIFSRVKSLYAKEPERPPPISPPLAILILVLYTIVYVLPFYLSRSTRPSATLSRDAPSVIRARINAVTTSCILCSITTILTLAANDPSDPYTSFGNALHSMGYFPVGILETLKAVLLTAVLFVGPLYEQAIVEGHWRDWLKLKGVNETVRSWIGYRNMVAGPITEEVLFRSASIPLLLLSHTSTRSTIFLAPIIFGLAHVHHFLEFRLTHPDTPLAAALLRSLLQFSYTTLFGAYASFLYLRSGSLLAVIATHAFCNWMGFPRFWGRLEAPEASAGSWGEGKRSEDRKETQRLHVGWTVGYYALLVVGAVGWWKLLWRLTESEGALASF